MPSLLNNAKAQFIDQNGLPLVNGTVGFYSPGTLNPLPTYQDLAGTIANTNPISLDSRGQAIIWGSGTYRQIVKDYNGITLWDQIVTSSDAAFTGNAGAALVGFDSTNLANILTTRLNRVVDSISALRALSKTTYTRVWVTGYYLPHDGGGGAYQYDPADTTTADNNGTVIVASDGGRWKLQLTGSVSLKQFGAKGDDTTDDTAALNKAIAWCVASGVALYIPSSTAAFRLTSTIVIPGNLVMTGEGCMPFGTISFTANNIHGGGSWFHIDHAGIGFSATATNTTEFCVDYKGIGTIRNQPTPNGAASFTPNPNDYDFSHNGVDIRLQDVFMLNPTKGVFSTGGGRVEVLRLRGQPFIVGLFVDTSYDTCHIDTVHFWPWWSQAQGCLNYTVNNLDAFAFGRTDNIMVRNIFSYAAHRSLLITQNANGTTTRMKLVNADFDYSYYGYFVDGTVGGHTAQIDNCTVTSFSASVATVGVYFDPASKNCETRWSKLHTTLHGSNGFRMYGTSNLAWVDLSKVQQWNGMGTGFPAFEAGTACSIKFSELPYCVSPTSGTPGFFGGAGSITSPLGTGVFNGTTDANGNVGVPIGFGVQPNDVGVSVINAGAALFAQPNTFTSTSFIVTFFNTAGAKQTNTAVNITYRCAY